MSKIYRCDEFQITSTQNLGQGVIFIIETFNSCSMFMLMFNKIAQVQLCHDLQLAHVNMLAN